MIMSSYFNVFAPKNDKDLCWYRPKPHFASVSKLLEGSVRDVNSLVSQLFLRDHHLLHVPERLVLHLLLLRYMTQTNTDDLAHMFRGELEWIRGSSETESDYDVLLVCSVYCLMLIYFWRLSLQKCVFFNYWTFGQV